MARRHRVYTTGETKKRYEQKIKSLVATSFMIVVALIPIGLYRARTQPVLQSGRAMDAAQVARNIARGAGVITGVIRPAAYGVSPHTAKPPDVANPPLHVWLLSRMPSLARGNILSPPDRSVINFSSFFYLMNALLLFYAARRLCGSPTAVISALLYLFSVPALTAAASGTGDSLAGSALTLFFLMAYLDRNQSLLVSLMTGVMLGICYLAFSASIVMLIPLCLAKMRSRERDAYRHCIATLIGVAVIAAPWMLRNIRIGGNALCGATLASVLLGSPEMPVSAMGGVWSRFHWQCAHYYATILRLYGGSVALMCLLLAPLVRYDDQPLQRLKSFFLVCLALVMIAELAGRGRAECMSAFLPFAFLLGTRTFMELIARGTPAEAMATRRGVGIFIAVNLIPCALVMLKAPDPPDKTESRDLLVRTLADMHSLMHSGDLILTNAQEMLAYYGEFNTLPLPGSAGDFARWERDYGRLKFAAICPYGERGGLAGDALTLHRVPDWFISERAYVYPRGEYFFSADATAAVPAGREG